MAVLLHVAVLGLICIAAFFDIRQRRIPNWLTFTALLVGLSLNAFAGSYHLLQSFLGLGLGVAVLFVPFALGWLGAGDVKMLGAVGAFLGVSYLPRIVFYSLLAAGVLSLLVVATNGWRRITGGSSAEAEDKSMATLSTAGKVFPGSVKDRSMKGAATIPWGVALGLGTLMSYYVDTAGKWAGF